jgi:uncharacterized protein (TIGR00288 family)
LSQNRPDKVAESVGVLVDGQNLYQSWSVNYGDKKDLDIKVVRDWIASHIGKIMLARYFIHIGIPGAPKFDEFLESIGMPGIRTVNLNVDTNLVAEGMEMLFRVSFNTLVLVAGDNDYLPLLKKFRSHGKTVKVLFFPEATGSWIRSQCDEFINIAEILPDIPRV